MNCHKAIEKGSEYGTAELTKIFASIGYNPDDNTYIKDYDKMAEADIKKIYTKWIGDNYIEDYNDGKEEAQQIKQKLEGGLDFGTLANKHSICPSAKKGGDLGEFTQGTMVKAFDNIVFRKPILKVHGPVKTKFGFHLIQTIYRS